MGVRRYPVQHVVQFSGGIGSWAAARRVAEKHGTEHLTLLFADTLIEDEDLYRFLDDAAEDIGVPITRIAEGRDPWQVFYDKRFIGNSRIDPCSEILKRNFLRAYLNEHFDPLDTRIYLGIDWTEEHRYMRARPRWAPYRVEAPLCEPPYVTKDVLLEDLKAAGIKPPRLYEMGFPHNNCGGFCIKAGQGHFKLLYERMPERFMEHARKEQELREHLDKDVSILKDRTGGTTKPLPLLEFKRRLDAKSCEVDPTDLGGCGCVA